MTAPFEKKMPGPSIHTTVSGHVTLAVGKEDGSSREVRADFPNMVLDSGLDHLLDGKNVLDFCVVGSSAAAVSPDQTALVAFIGANSSGGLGGTSTVISADPYTVETVAKYRFNPGAAQGNVAEVGFGDPYQGYDKLFSRALVRDSEGQPVAVTVLADEYLDVTYVLTTVVDIADAPFTMNLSTGSVSGVLRPAYRKRVGDKVTKGFAPVEPAWHSYTSMYSDGALGDIYSEPTGASKGGISVSQVPPFEYVKGSFYRDYAYKIDVNSGNMPGGLYAMATSSIVPGYQLSFDPPVPKTNERVFTFGIRLSVGRG